MGDPADAAQLHAALARLREAPNDQAAWAVLFRTTWPFVLALCHRSLPASQRVQAAEDVAQQVFLKFARYWHQKRPAIQDRDALFSLLAVMVRKLASDARRWEGRAKRGLGHQEIPADELVGPTDAGQQTVDLRDEMDKVCERLQPRERQVLLLRLQDYKVEEIAAQLGVGARTIERDLQVLRSALGAIVN